MRVLVTGVGGLVGSTFAEAAVAAGHEVLGVESDHRGRWFGAAGSVKWRLDELKKKSISITVADFRTVPRLARRVDAVVHCAGQPSHDLSHSIVMEDSHINYFGTVQLLEEVRRNNKGCRFVFLSTNKVYGDRINKMPFSIHEGRFELSCGCLGVTADGVNEDFNVDGSLHTPFGVSKLAADLMVQEYARSYGLHTVCFRCGCLTGSGGSAVEMHGFLGYIVRAAVHGLAYTIYGHRGMQVRDNLAAEDFAKAVLLWLENPRLGVYNMGGGAANSVSVNEVIGYLRSLGFDMEVRLGPPRLGDHKWWITNTFRFERDYPAWAKTRSVWEVLDEMVGRERSRRGAEEGHPVVPAGVDATAGFQQLEGGASPQRLG